MTYDTKLITDQAPKISNAGIHEALLSLTTDAFRFEPYKFKITSSVLNYDPSSHYPAPGTAIPGTVVHSGTCLPWVKMKNIRDGGYVIAEFTSPITQDLGFCVFTKLDDTPIAIVPLNDPTPLGSGKFWTVDQGLRDFKFSVEAGDTVTCTLMIRMTKAATSFNLLRINVQKIPEYDVVPLSHPGFNVIIKSVSDPSGCDWPELNIRTTTGSFHSIQACC